MARLAGLARLETWPTMLEGLGLGVGDGMGVVGGDWEKGNTFVCVVLCRFVLVSDACISSVGRRKRRVRR